MLSNFFWSLLWKKTGSIIAVYGDGDIPIPTGTETSRTGQLICNIGKKKANNLEVSHNTHEILKNILDIILYNVL